MYECFHCGTKSVVWDCDYDFVDFGYEGKVSYIFVIAKIVEQILNTEFQLKKKIKVII